jgi:trehalose/maltose transport system permease protein
MVADMAGRHAAGRIRRLRRKPFGRVLARVPIYLVSAVVLVYCLFPFYWVVRSSFTPEVDLFQTPIKYFPSHPTLENYRGVLSANFFTDALVNSAIVAGSVTLLSLAIGASAAFALGRLRFRGRSFVMYLMLSMTIFPQIAILGALYTTIARFHLYDTLGALIFSYLVFTLPFTIWVLSSFMRALPGDLEEAAYVDGATPLQVFWKVLLPLMAPGLVTTGMLAFISAWNEYLYAVSFIESPNHYTVPVAITSFVSTRTESYAVQWGQIMAATVIITLPLILLVLVLQRRIIAGLTAGAFEAQPSSRRSLL